MDQEILISSIESHLDALASLVNAVVGIALLAGWAGLQGSKSVSIFSVTANRQHAFFLLALVFIGVNVSIAMSFLRIGDLLRLVDGANTGKALATLALHPWPFNPYAYFGPSPLSILYSSIGYGCLITIWWIGYSALYLLLVDESHPLARLGRWMLTLFLLAGLASMLSVQSVYGIVLTEKLDGLAPELRAGIEATIIPRAIAVFVGIGVGVGISAATQRFAVRGRRKTADGG